MSALVIGALRDRVRLEAPQRVDGSGGAATVSWSSIGEMYARVESLTGRELAEADTRIARATHRITIRYRGDLTPSMRFVHRGRVFEIQSAQPRGGQGRWLQCMCEERIP